MTSSDEGDAGNESHNDADDFGPPLPPSPQPPPPDKPRLDNEDFLETSTLVHPNQHEESVNILMNKSVNEVHNSTITTQLVEEKDSNEKDTANSEVPYQQTMVNGIVTQKHEMLNKSKKGPTTIIPNFKLREYDRMCAIDNVDGKLECSGSCPFRCCSKYRQHSIVVRSHYHYSEKNIVDKTKFLKTCVSIKLGDSNETEFTLPKIACDRTKRVFKRVEVCEGYRAF